MWKKKKINWMAYDAKFKKEKNKMIVVAEASKKIPLEKIKTNEKASNTVQKNKTSHEQRNSLLPSSIANIQ